jgi:hypothetical protein
MTDDAGTRGGGDRVTLRGGDAVNRVRGDTGTIGSNVDSEPNERLF